MGKCMWVYFYATENNRSSEDRQVEGEEVQLESVWKPACEGSLV